MRDVEGQIEITVHPCLSSEQRVDAPATGDPASQAGGVQHAEHTEHLGCGQPWSVIAR